MDGLSIREMSRGTGIHRNNLHLMDSVDILGMGVYYGEKAKDIFRWDFIPCYSIR